MSAESPKFHNLLAPDAAQTLYHALPRTEVTLGVERLNADNAMIAKVVAEGGNPFGPEQEEIRTRRLHGEIARTLIDKAEIANTLHRLGLHAAPLGGIVPINQDTTPESIASHMRRLEEMSGQSGEDAKWHIKPERGMRSRGVQKVTGFAETVQALLARYVDQTTRRDEQLTSFEDYVVQTRIPFHGLLPEIQAFQEISGKEVNPRLRIVRLATTNDKGEKQLHMGAWHYVNARLDMTGKKLAPHYAQYGKIATSYYRGLQNEVVPVTTNSQYENMILNAANTAVERLQDHIGQELPFISMDAAITPDGYEALQAGDQDRFVAEGFAPWEFQPMPGWAGKKNNAKTGKVETESFRGMMKMMRVFAYGSVAKR